MFSLDVKTRFYYWAALRIQIFTFLCCGYNSTLKNIMCISGVSMKSKLYLQHNAYKFEC